jgi:hypothetical protein
LSPASTNADVSICKVAPFGTNTGARIEKFPTLTEYFPEDPVGFDILILLINALLSMFAT